MTLVTLFLMLVSGQITSVRVDQDICEKAVQAIREGQRVTVEDQFGVQHEVERARCIFDPIKETGGPTS